MIKLGEKSVSVMVVYCTMLHLWWAFMIAMDRSSLNATAVEALYRLIDDWAILIFLLILASCMSIAGMMISRSWSFLLILPQQAFLIFSATGAIGAIWLSQYADGVVRPRSFISADQFHIVLAAASHTVAVIMHAKSGTGKDG